MKILIILGLWLGLYGMAYSQTITLKDKETGLPIVGASLMSEVPKAFATTNALGQINIKSFKGSEKIVITSLGYKSELKSYSELEALSFAVLLNVSDLELGGLVVSATRWNQNARDIPSKIVSISAREAAIQNPQTAADLLAVSGKVYIQKSQQGGGSPMIRGFSTNRLLYTIDGVRMNTAIFRGGNLQNVISLDPFAIENTEVFFGPGSVIYGSDAIGGVMSFKTLTPQLSADDKVLVSGKAVTRYSSANNEKTGHFDIGVGWNKWAIATSFSSHDFGDLRMGSNGPDEYLRPFYVQRIDSVDVIVTNDDPKVQKPSGYSQINMMQKIRFKPNDKWDFQYGFHYSETSDYSRYDRHIRYKNGLPRYGEWYYGPQKWMMNNLNITHTSNGNVYDQMTIRLAQQYFEESRISRDINKPDRETRTEGVDAYSANVDFTKGIGKKHHFFYGVEALINDVTSTGVNEDIDAGSAAPGPSRYPQASWSSYGVYATDQFKISDKFLLQGGVRYNQVMLDAQFDTTFYPFPFTAASLSSGALTGSFGAVYRPTDKWVISANGATAFRSPNVDDIGKVFDSEPGAVVIPNPNLKAEYAYSGDLSVAKIFGKSVKVDVTGYYTQLKDALVRRDFTLNGDDSILYDGELSQVQAIQNAAIANVYGVQVGMEIKLAKGFGISSDFNYQLGKEELEDGTISPSRHAPPWYGNTKLSYRTGKLNLQWYAQYYGERKFEDMPEEEKGKTEIYAIDDNGNPYSPGWYTVNFKAMYQFTSNFTVSAGLENITDQRYRPYSSGIVAPGRNFVLSLRCLF